MNSILHLIDDICILSSMLCWRYVFYDKILQDKKGCRLGAFLNISNVWQTFLSQLSSLVNYLVIECPRIPACCPKGVSSFGMIATHLSSNALERDTFSRNRPVGARAHSPFLSQQSRRLKY